MLPDLLNFLVLGLLFLVFRMDVCNLSW